MTSQKARPNRLSEASPRAASATRALAAFIVDSFGKCEAPPAPRPGSATLTVGRDSVTLDPLLPRDEFDRRAARWDGLAIRAFGRS